MRKLCMFPRASSVAWEGGLSALGRGQLAVSTGSGMNAGGRETADGLCANKFSVFGEGVSVYRGQEVS